MFMKNEYCKAIDCAQEKHKAEGCPPGKFRVEWSRVEACPLSADSHGNEEQTKNLESNRCLSRDFKLKPKANGQWEPKTDGQDRIKPMTKNRHT